MLQKMTIPENQFFFHSVSFGFGSAKEKWVDFIEVMSLGLSESCILTKTGPEGTVAFGEILAGVL
jgi:hypothetical protein